MQIIDQEAPSQHKPKILAFGGWLALCFSASITGIFISPDDWYASLNKPSWNPPGWVFGPVWTTLYFMMAYSAWTVWKQGGWAAQRKPLFYFLIQLVLNAAWTPLFFGLHKPGLALVNIVLLGLAIVITMIHFWRVSPAAGFLLAPYLAWVSFASYLNFTIWKMNP